MSCGPSISHEANINGSTGINALHTTSDMIGGRVAWDMIFLLKILPQAQLSAAARVSIKPHQWDMPRRRFLHQHQHAEDRQRDPRQLFAL